MQWRLLESNRTLTPNPQNKAQMWGWMDRHDKMTSAQEHLCCLWNRGCLSKTQVEHLTHLFPVLIIGILIDRWQQVERSDPQQENIDGALMFKEETLERL